MITGVVEKALIRAGWKVLRASHHDVLTSMDVVHESILRHGGKP